MRIVQDGGRLCHGEDFALAAKEVWENKSAGLKAIGMNCTEEKNIPDLLGSLNKEALHIPLVIYPNTADFREYEDPNRLGGLAKEWLASYPHVWAVGGCCGCSPRDIAGLRDALLQ